MDRLFAEDDLGLITEQVTSRIRLTTKHPALRGVFYAFILTSIRSDTIPKKRRYAPLIFLLAIEFMPHLWYDGNTTVRGKSQVKSCERS